MPNSTQPERHRILVTHRAARTQMIGITPCRWRLTVPRRICRARRTRLRAAQQRTPWRATSAIGIRALRMLRIANGVSDDGDGLIVVND